MKRTGIWKWLGIGMIVVIAGVWERPATAQSTNETNAFTAGPLAGVAKVTMKVKTTNKLPSKLCGLLWPDNKAPNCLIKKLEMPEDHEGRAFCVRLDNQDLLLIHRHEIKTGEDSKNREESYYRTTVKGDLVLALTAIFEYKLDDVDNELLKNLTYKSYSTMAGDGKPHLPISHEVRKKFEAEKKYWLGLEKKMEKMKKQKKED